MAIPKVSACFQACLCHITAQTAPTWVQPLACSTPLKHGRQEKVPLNHRYVSAVAYSVGPCRASGYPCTACMIWPHGVAHPYIVSHCSEQPQVAQVSWRNSGAVRCFV